MKTNFIPLLCLTASLFPVMGFAETYRLRPLDTGLPAASQVYPLSINDFGYVLTQPQINIPGATFDTYLTHSGHSVPFGNLGGMFSFKVNDLFNVVGEDPNFGFGVVTTPSGQTTNITYPGGLYTVAQGLNNLGVVAGYTGFMVNTSGYTKGFIFKNGTFTDVSYPQQISPNLTSTQLTAINDLGDVAGDWSTAITWGAFWARGGKFHDLVFPADPYNGLYGVPLPITTGINDVDTVVGAYIYAAKQYTRGFVSRNGKTEFIDFTSHEPTSIPGTTGTLLLQPFSNNQIMGINNLGQIVGEWTGTYSYTSPGGATETQTVVQPYIGDPVLSI